MVNLEHIRRDIILKKGIHYFDYTASGLAYKPIEDEVADILKTYANTHSDSSFSAIITQRRYEGARESLKKLLGLDERFYLIACGQGATAAIKKFQELLGIYLPPATRDRLGLQRESIKELPLFIISPFEHHSVEISLRQGLCEVVRVPLDPSGLMDFARLGEILSANKGREIYGVLTAASNVTGLKLDYKRAYLMLKSHGGRLFVDASALIAHENVDTSFCDGVFFGAHKLLGGVGASGILAARKELLRGEEPTFAGGGTIKYADALTQRFIIDKERLEEAGTPGIIALVRTYLALKLRKSAGLEAIKSREEAICKHFISEISKIPEIEIYGNLTAPRVPIFAFNMQGLGADALAGVLGQKFEIQTRAGCDCAAPYGFDLLGLQPDTEMSRKPAWVRASFSFIHDESDVDFLAEALRQIAQIRDKITFVAGKYRCGSVN